MAEESSNLTGSITDFRFFFFFFFNQRLILSLVGIPLWFLRASPFAPPLLSISPPSNLSISDCQVHQNGLTSFFFFFSPAGQLNFQAFHGTHSAFFYFSPSQNLGFHGPLDGDQDSVISSLWKSLTSQLFYRKTFMCDPSFGGNAVNSQATVLYLTVLILCFTMLSQTPVLGLPQILGDTFQGLQKVVF